MRTQQEKFTFFKNLHHAEKIFLLPNVWDTVSAKIFESAGYSALGTTSAGIAATFGMPDGQVISKELMIETLTKIITSVKVPVSVDIEAGYNSTIDKICETVLQLIEVGAVGINIEDSFSNKMVHINYQSQLIEELKKVSNAHNNELFINARTDVFWLNHNEESEQLLNHAIDRSNHYLRAGADCVFIPGVSKPSVIEKLVNGINGPLNILASSNSPTISVLENLGVARVSLGSGPVRSTLSHIMKIAKDYQMNGTCSNWSEEIISYDSLQDFLKEKE